MSRRHQQFVHVHTEKARWPVKWTDLRITHNTFMLHSHRSITSPKVRTFPLAYEPGSFLHDLPFVTHWVPHASKAEPVFSSLTQTHSPPHSHTCSALPLSCQLSLPQYSIPHLPLVLVISCMELANIFLSSCPKYSSFCICPHRSDICHLPLVSQSCGSVVVIILQEKLSIQGALPFTPGLSRCGMSLHNEENN